VANAAVCARGEGASLVLAGGRIDALVTCEGSLLRTSAPQSVHAGLGQLRRGLVSRQLAVLHVVFAPVRPRPVLLGLVQLANRTPQPIRVRYSELWDLRGRDVRAEEGACVSWVGDREHALADAGLVIRAQPPKPLPEVGLALDVELVLPPEARRKLVFAYAAAEPGVMAAALVQGWRGDVQDELARSTASWLARAGGASGALDVYREQLRKSEP
jgi:hypothetical protein